jgi:hypothetical protein
VNDADWTAHHVDARHDENADPTRRDRREEQRRREARARGAPAGCEDDEDFGECPKLLTRGMVTVVGSRDVRRQEFDVTRTNCERLLWYVLSGRERPFVTEYEFDMMARVNEGQRVRWMQRQGHNIDPNTLPPSSRRKCERRSKKWQCVWR